MNKPLGPVDLTESAAGEEDPGSAIDLVPGDAQRSCPDCGGSGRRADLVCETCGGTGRLASDSGGA